MFSTGLSVCVCAFILAQAFPTGFLSASILFVACVCVSNEVLVWLSVWSKVQCPAD